MSKEWITAKLRPCPFCRESRRLGMVVKWMTIRDGYAKAGAYVACKRCHSRGPIVKSDDTLDVRNERIGGEPKDRLIAKAASAWNGAEAASEGCDLPLFGQNGGECR